METRNICMADTDNKIMSKVLSTISSILFKDKKYESLLLDRLQEMSEQRNWEFPNGPTDNGCAVKYVEAPEGYEDYGILGFDIPTLIRLDDNVDVSDIIMVVSQDPRRTERFKGMLSLSSPFGFHDKSYRHHARKGFMTPLVYQALKDNHTALYFTDYYKLYTTDERGVLKSDTLKYMEILRKEIELIKPRLIIAHGSKAQSVLQKMQKTLKFDLEKVSYIGNSRMKREERERAKAAFLKVFNNAII